MKVLHLEPLRWRVFAHGRLAFLACGFESI